jgi:magnesium chelatase subunit I
MIMGDRGTGKSTTVRALVDLLPDIQVVATFNSDPDDPELMSQEVREKKEQNRSIDITTRKLRWSICHLARPKIESVEQ